jgi:hypothetical protein
LYAPWPCDRLKRAYPEVYSRHLQSQATSWTNPNFLHEQHDLPLISPLDAGSNH